MNRIKGGFNAEKSKRLVSSIDEEIKKIVKLTSGAIALEPLRLDRRRKANAAYWTKFRQHAEQLYEAFHSRWSSSCACQSPHQANLRLEIQEETKLENSPAFKFLFPIDINLATAPSLRCWRAAEIRPLGNQPLV